jgi:hypothetical protein
VADTTIAAERFDRLAGWCALAGAALSVVYSIGFVVLKNASVYSVALMAGGILSTVALLAVYERVRAGGSLARIGLLLALAGTLGAAIHGAFDLAVVLHPEAQGTGGGGPFPVDPRGFLTFGVAGLGLLALTIAGLSVDRLPRNVLYVGMVFGVVLVLIYLGRLIVLDATSILVLGPALIGAILSPIWYGWIGWLLLSRRI